MKSLRLFAVSLGLGVSVLVAGCGGAPSGGGGSNPPAPAISSISPTSVPAGSALLTLNVSGSGFLSTSVVQVGGTAETTGYVSDAQLTATVPAAQMASGAQLAVMVVNGSLNSSGTPINLEVDNPSPTIASISPASEVLGATTPLVTVTGTGFVSTTGIIVNGTARVTTFVSATQVSATLTAADIATAGTLSLTAVNPSPGGGTSSAVSLTMNNPPVGAIQLNPSTLIAGTTTSTTITVTGSTFVSASVVQLNGTARTTTYVSPTSLTFAATVADQATAGTLAITVTSPAPGGGTSPAADLVVNAPTPTPVITSVTPSSIVEGSPDTLIAVAGTGFTQNSIVQWNGSALATNVYYNGAYQLSATVPAADLTALGTASVTVSTPTAIPALSSAVTVSITNPPVPTLTSIYPNAGPINTAATVGLTGTGFTPNTTVAVNGETVASTFQTSNAITCTLSASSLALPGNLNITVTTPAPGGGTAAPLTYTTYLDIANNDIVYNATDGLLYASLPVTGVGSGGNSVAGIDPVTGNIVRQILVGTNPNKLALSTDGTQLFVGLDGAGAVAQVDLTKGAVVNQFAIGGGPGAYNQPYTAGYLAAVPGSPDSVAVAAVTNYNDGNGVTIYDSGIARANSSSGVGEGPLSFGSSSSILYVASGAIIEKLTVGSTGVTAATALATASYSVTSMQYDNGQLYLSTGQVLSASTGALLGTFYSSASNPATGPIVSDSKLGRAFVGEGSYTSSAEVLAFNAATFNATGSVAVNGVGPSDYPVTFQKMVRWGQSGIAFNTTFGAYTPVNQIFIFQSPLVKDLSASPADLSVTLTAPATASTGTPISWVAKISNKGPDQAQGATLTMNLDSSLIISSVTPSQGSCGTGPEFTCDLGSLGNGASATVTVSATPSTSGTLAGIATVSSTSYDPTVANNQAATNTVVSGSLYSAVPLISAISPNFLQAGSSAFTLTVTGADFNEGSTVNLATTPLATTYVSATQLTAAVTSSEIANYGWAAVTVSNPSPGGGVSQVLPLTIYTVVNVPASGLLFDPYSQQLYATVPSTATNITGNSVVAINPFTGASGTPVDVGSEPTVMAETADGKYLYVGLSGSSSLAQFDPLHQELLQTISLSSPSTLAGANPVAAWLSVMPGTDTTLAISISAGDGIFDINGSTGAYRTKFANGNSPQFADASTLYSSSGGGLYGFSIDASGATQTDGISLNGLGDYGSTIQLVDGLIYGVGGGIVNPATTPPSQIATLPLFDFYASGIAGEGVAVDADPSLQKDFLMMENLAGTLAYGLTRYDLTTYLPEALIDIPLPLTGNEDTWTMLRFGQDGLALFSSGENYSNGQTATSIILLQGPFVSPQLLATSSAATLTSSSSSSITHGVGNTLLTLTGTNLLPGVAVTWNGTYRTTTIVDATHVTVAIPASDLASTGTASLAATNPGASASNALQITIN
jgi:trimeric autotransporter adhesin